MKKVAVIPARGGSTRLIDKNIYPLGGKPLIRWMTEAVIESNSFDDIVISTDSDKIFNTIKDLKVIRHFRPPEHATVRATVLNAIINFMENSETKYDILAYMLPTCPFVSSTDIINGLGMLDETTDFVVSMTQFSETIQLACLMKNDFVLPVFDNLESGITNSKFLKKYYRPSGAFYIGRWNSIIDNKNFFKGNVKGFVIPEDRSIDINNINDINFAEAKISENKHRVK